VGYPSSFAPFVEAAFFGVEEVFAVGLEFALAEFGEDIGPVTDLEKALGFISDAFVGEQREVGFRNVCILKVELAGEVGKAVPIVEADEEGGVGLGPGDEFSVFIGEVDGLEDGGFGGRLGFRGWCGWLWLRWRWLIGGLEDSEGVMEVALRFGVEALEASESVEGKRIPVVHGEAGGDEIAVELVKVGLNLAAMPVGEDQGGSEDGDERRGAGELGQPSGLDLFESEVWSEHLDCEVDRRESYRMGEMSCK
jgi:hypothetical protein